jgi:hypothetical protein
VYEKPHLAPKGPGRIAQGNALGNEHEKKFFFLGPERATQILGSMAVVSPFQGE